MNAYWEEHPEFGAKLSPHVHLDARKPIRQTETAMAKTEIATDIEELDYVELARDIEGFPAGTRGTVVSADPAADSYTVEVSDDEGASLEFLFGERADFVLLQRARQVARGNGSRP